MTMDNESPGPSVFTGVFGNRSGPRSRNGCRTCRSKKVKCCETRPVCQRCMRLSRICTWDPPSKTRRPRGLGNHCLDERDSGPPIDEEQDDQRCPSTTDLTIANDPSDSLIAARSSYQPFTISPSPYEGTSPSGLYLGRRDHEAIVHYRTSFTSSQDTKNPLYSVPSILFRIGVSSPTIMHMVLAIGRQYMTILANEEQDDDVEQSVEAVSHYSQALQLFGSKMGGELDPSELDTILSTLWLMIVYEQRFGDGTGQAISKHLQGAASILEATLHYLPMLPLKGNQVMSTRLLTRDIQEVTYLSSRLIVWLTGVDARAASFGLGGYLNRTLAQSLGLKHLSDSETTWSSFLSAIYDHSTPLFQTMWGVEYPEAEILYDLENQSVFQLFRECAQMRLIIAQLTNIEPAHQVALVSSVNRKIESLEKRYSHLFTTAASISWTPRVSRTAAASEGLIMTLCWVIPHYYASVLDFHRTTRLQSGNSPRRMAALTEIMKLAYHGLKMGNPQAMFRIAWPLFMAGLETNDPIHQQWILDRFKKLEAYGKNYQKASRFLEDVMVEKEKRGFEPHDLDLMEAIPSGRFFI